MAVRTPNAAPAQDFVPIKEVRDGVVVLKDGSLRSVLMASSLNLALKSEDEQKAVLFQFQNFLNSLDFSIQFFIESRQLDIRPYVALLEKRYTEQSSDLMKIQVREYIDFVKTFTEGANIMTKSFFVIVPYSPPILNTPGGGGILKSLGSISSVLPGGKGTSTGTPAAEAAAAFEESRSQLEQRLDIVESGLVRSGVRVARLQTEEVIELFYRMFNIGELDRPIPGTNAREPQPS